MFKFNSSINCVDLISNDIANELKNQKIRTTINEENVPVEPLQPTCDCTLTTCECDISNETKKIECLNATQPSCELDCSTDECDRKKKRQTIVLNAEEPYLPPLVDTRKIKKEVNCLCVPKDLKCSLSDNWSTEISGGFAVVGNGVAYGGNDTWVAVGKDNVVGGDDTILRSTDNGVTWTAPTSGSLFAIRGLGVAYGGNDRWVAVGQDTVNGDTILRSTDNGETWMPASVPLFANIGFGVAYGGNDRWVAVGDDTNGFDNTILRSTDNGETWTASTSGSLFTTRGLGVAYGGNDTWVAVGQGSDTILYSGDNGVTWTASTSGSFDFAGYGVAYGGNDTWVAVGATVAGGDTILYSEDNGVTWIPASGSSFAIVGYGVAYCEDGLWVAVGANSGTCANSGDCDIRYSEDGKFWNTVTTNPISIDDFDNSSSSPAFGNGKLIIPGKFDNNNKSFLINDLDIIPGIDCSNKCVIPEYEKSLVISIQSENQKNESFVMSGFENSNSSNKALLYPRVNETVNVSRAVKKVNTNNVKRYVAPPIIEGYGPSYNGNPIKRGMTMSRSYSCIKTQPLKCFNKISFGKKIV